MIYATCFANYNQPEVGAAARKVLAHNGVETVVVYPRCCGMPQLEEGDIERVADNARHVAGALGEWIDKGYDVIGLVASCALMLKLEWPLILPEDPAVKRLAEHSYDICEYVVGISRSDGLAPGLAPIDGGITLHLPCHERAQNVGRKSADMLALVPDTEVSIIERCSGHGGSIGVTKGFHETALKVGRTTARRAREAANPLSRLGMPTRRRPHRERDGPPGGQGRRSCRRRACRRAAPITRSSCWPVPTASPETMSQPRRALTPRRHHGHGGLREGPEGTSRRGSRR